MTTIIKGIVLLDLELLVHMILLEGMKLALINIITIQIVTNTVALPIIIMISARV